MKLDHREANADTFHSWMYISVLDELQMSSMPYLVLLEDRPNDNGQPHYSSPFSDSRMKSSYIAGRSHSAER